MPFRSLTGLLLLLAMTAPAAEGQRLGVTWRGPLGNGVFPDARPPTSWDAAAGKGMVWKVDMPNIASSTPVVVGGSVFTTAEPDWLLCLDAATGEERWRRQLDACALPGYTGPAGNRQALDAIADMWRRWYVTCTEKPPRGGAGGNGDKRILGAYRGSRTAWSELQYAGASPVADDEVVVVKFGTGVVGAFTHDGKPLWAQAYPVTDLHVAVSSPILCGEAVIYQCSRGKGKGNRRLFLRANDRRTGRPLWESADAPDHFDPCATPAVATVGDRAVIVQGNGVVVDVRTGDVLAQTLAKCGDGSSPVPVGDTVYFYDYGLRGEREANAGEKEPGSGAYVYAVKLAPKGDGVEATRTWECFLNRSRMRLHGSVVVGGGFVYPPRHARQVISAADGQLVHEGQRGWNLTPHRGVGYWYASAAIAGDRLYVMAPNASVGIYSLGAEPKLLGVGTLTGRVAEKEGGKVTTASVGEKTVGSPFFAGKRVYIRTYRRLWCLGE